MKDCVGCTFAAYVYFWGFKIGALKSGAIISLLKKFPEVLNLRDFFIAFFYLFFWSLTYEFHELVKFWSYDNLCSAVC